MSNSVEPSLQQVKGRMRAMWMAGDFGKLAPLLQGMAETFSKAMDLCEGDRVLDVACGTGNSAILLARAGAKVTGLDLVPNLLEQARGRAEKEGLEIILDEGDVEALPYKDGEFDAVVSMFGAMYAPRPDVAVKEMARVLRPGGHLGLSTWTPGGFNGQMFAVGSRYMRLPPGMPNPVDWGNEATVRERLSHDFTEIRMDTVPGTFHLEMSASDAEKFFDEYSGPSKMMAAQLDAEKQAALAVDMEALWSGANEAGDPTRETLIRTEYLLVRARRR